MTVSSQGVLLNAKEFSQLPKPFTRRQVCSTIARSKGRKERTMKAKDAMAAAAERRAEYDAWYEEQVRLGLQDLDAGRVVSDDDVRKHFEKRFKQHAGRQQKQAA
jgi:predicted transcriptional regulator